MKFTFKYTLLTFAVAFLFTACGSRKKIVYLQDIDKKKSENAVIFEPKLQPNDLLSITVSGENPELTVPFNLPEIQSTDPSKSQNNIKTYLIDASGNIYFPVIGKIKLAGLTKNEANKEISKLVSEYFSNPSINISILNYKISVLGEVSKPGTYSISSDRITLLEALGLAGDLTIYGKRENLLIIREENGKKSYNRINLTQSDFINSPFYYLNQNDLVYVEPNKARINGSVIGSNIGVILSALSIVLTLTYFIINTN